MEFRRVEIKRTLRHVERITDGAEIKRVLDAIHKNDLKFTARLAGIGLLKECSILSFRENGVKLFSRHPQKAKLDQDFSDIEVLEVESNCDFVEENDDGGRWARLF